LHCSEEDVTKVPQGVQSKRTLPTPSHAPSQILQTHSSCNSPIKKFTAHGVAHGGYDCIQGGEGMAVNVLIVVARVGVLTLKQAPVRFPAHTLSFVG
jgi:hypothetical protein